MTGGTEFWRSRHEAEQESRDGKTKAARAHGNCQRLTSGAKDRSRQAQPPK
jgi:hypothetical protein